VNIDNRNIIALMQINKLLGKPTPAHPELVPILKAIREKYNFPEIAPGDDTIAEILNSENEIGFSVHRPWRTVRIFRSLEKMRLPHKQVTAPNNSNLNTYTH